MIALKAAAVVTWLIAFGFGAPAPFVAAFLLRERRLPQFLGLFPAYGGGLFERLSPEVFAVTLGLWAGVCAIDAFAAWLVWEGYQLGGVLLLALLPFELVFWVGFAVPIPPLTAIARAALLASNWSSLTDTLTR